MAHIQRKPQGAAVLLTLALPLLTSTGCVFRMFPIGGPPGARAARPACHPSQY